MIEVMGLDLEQVRGAADQGSIEGFMMARAEGMYTPCTINMMLKMYRLLQLFSKTRLLCSSSCKYAVVQ